MQSPGRLSAKMIRVTLDCVLTVFAPAEIHLTTENMKDIDGHVYVFQDSAGSAINTPQTVQNKRQEKLRNARCVCVSGKINELMHNSRTFLNVFGEHKNRLMLVS